MKFKEFIGEDKSVKVNSAFDAACSVLDKIKDPDSDDISSEVARVGGVFSAAANALTGDEMLRLRLMLTDRYRERIKSRKMAADVGTLARSLNFPPIGIPVVMDSQEMFWLINKAGKLQVIGDDSEGAGYDCESIEHAAAVLRELGYI